jgi:hypothetical protein
MLARPKHGDVELDEPQIRDSSSDEQPEDQAILSKSAAVASKFAFSADNIKIASPTLVSQKKNKSKEKHIFLSENGVGQTPLKEPDITVFDALAAKLQQSAIEDWVRSLESIQHVHD